MNICTVHLGSYTYLYNCLFPLDTFFRNRNSGSKCMPILTVFSKNQYPKILCVWGGSFFRAALVTYGSSQVRDQIEAAAAGLHHSHSNMGSKPHLRPTPEPMTMLDPYPTEQGQGLNLHPHGY